MSINTVFLDFRAMLSREWRPSPGQSRYHYSRLPDAQAGADAVVSVDGAAQAAQCKPRSGEASELKRLIEVVLHSRLFERESL
jgi:hypothetical protein